MAAISNNNIANAIYMGSRGKEGQELTVFVNNVIKFLIRKKLFSKAGDILEKIENVSNIENGILKVKIYSAQKLDEVIKKDLTLILIKKYNSKNVFFTEITDTKFIGGLKIEVGDEVLDLTIFNKLKELQKYLIR